MDTKITKTMLEESGYKLPLWLLEAKVSGQKYTEAWEDPEKITKQAQRPAHGISSSLRRRQSNAHISVTIDGSVKAALKRARGNPNIAGQCERLLPAWAM